MQHSESKPIHLTLLRHGDLIVVDLAETGALIPRSETHVDDSFLRDIAVEMERVAQRGAGTARELARIGGLVFSHLLTENARRLLRESRATDLYLRLDERLVHVPWELAHDGEQFLLSRFRIGRQVITTRAIPDTGRTRPSSDQLRVLLVADPTETLPQAAAEAEELCRLLDRVPGVAVTMVSGSAVRRIPLLAALQENDVVHFAGHSYYDPVLPARSGWQLADGTLCAADLAKLRPPPLLVFSNSCEAASSAAWEGGAGYEGHAFGIGSAFLLAGVPSYVGTFWVVHDAESIDFATTYYRTLARGGCLGDALHEAQRAVIERHGSDRLSWASYLLYGDPALRPLEPARSSTETPLPPSGAARVATAPRGAPREEVRFEVSLAGDRDAPEPRVGRVADARPVIGRGAELRDLNDALRAARRGERHVALISGPAGIGKTTLIDAFVAQARAEGDTWIAQGQSIEQYGSGEAYLPLLEALGQLARQDESRSFAACLRRCAPTWAAQLPALLDPAEHEAVLRRNQGSSRERMLRELAELLEVATAEGSPLVLVLEDLHWSDRATIEALAYLAKRRTPARLLVIATYRPADVMAGDHPLRSLAQELLARGQGLDLRLDALPVTDVVQMLCERLDADSVDSELARLLYQRTEGHPLFVANVIDFAQREGLIVAEGRRIVLRDHGAAALASEIPAGLRAMIERQIEALPGDDQRVLEAAAVVGAEFSVAAVAAALDAGLDELDDRCSGLAWRGQFLRAAGLDEWPDATVAGRYRFVHALYQNVLYERIPEPRRIRLHRRVGERRAAAFASRIDEIAGELAAHFEGARDLKRAAEYQMRAGDVAVRRHADREAIVHFQKVLGLAPRLTMQEERSRIELDVLVRLASPLMSTAGYAAREVEVLFERARTLARELPPGPHVAPLLRGLASFYQVRSQNQLALAVGEELLAYCAGGDDGIALVQAHYGHGVTLHNLGRLDEARRHILQAYALYDPATHPTHVAVYGGYDPGVAALAWQGFIQWLRGEADEALRWGEGAVTLAEQLGHPFTITFAAMSVASTHLYRGEVERALPYIATAGDVAREDGFSYHLGVVTGLEAWATLLQGKPADAVALGEEALRILRETAAEISLPAFAAIFAMAKAFTGRLEDALADVDAALAEAERGEQVLHLGLLYRSRAALLLMRGREGAHVEAEALYRRAWDLACRLGAPMLELDAATGLARLMVEQGRPSEGRAALQPICERLASQPLVGVFGEARSLLAELERSA